MTGVLVAAAFLWATFGASLAYAAPSRSDLQGWKVERGQYQCSLIRTKGAKFELEVSDSLGTATLFAYRFVPGDFRERPAQIELEPGGNRIASGLSAEWIYGGLVVFNVPTKALEGFSSSTGLVVSVDGKKKFDFRFDPPGDAVRALDACHASLLRSWGVDPALLSTLSRQPAPIGSDHPWISKKELDEVATDVMALLHGGGSAILTYVVQPDGRIADCRVVVSSGLPSLDNFACQSFSINAHFDPALGADGQPVPVRVADIVHWAFI